MASFRSLFPSKYLAAEDLDGSEMVVEIKHVIVEEVGEDKEEKPIVYFRGVPKGLLLNKTNGKRIVEFYGEETDDWIGGELTLYPSEVDFKGDTVPCIRVRKKEDLAKRSKSRKAEPDAPREKAPVDDLTDEELEEVRRKRSSKRTAGAK